MCVAIPMGKRDSQHGTRFGRFLRARPSRITSLAALGVLSVGLLLLARQPASWPFVVILLVNAAALPMFGILLERLPTRCRGSEIGYPRYGMIGLTALLAALLFLTGHAGAILGALLLALTWHLAARPLNWQLAWCREPPPSGLRHLPRILTAGALPPLLVAASTLAGMPLLPALSVLLFGVPVGLLAALLLGYRADFADA
ncbi:hypothetical protein [uncultured Thiocystis sp.]|uniref:hypothetical protein n=1 Tax=uncultured Thiocystis sp. TaxID=1202134 RepID=UPI0025D6CE88|nr:hypothetical protein [uncultured Thiocystis sp.]